MAADLWQDLRYAIRSMRRNPGFAASAVLTLTLGIGANTAIFSVVNALLLRPLPYASPNRLALIDGNFLKLGMERIGATASEYLAYREQSQVFESVAAFQPADFNLTGIDQPERLAGCNVSASLFPLLGAGTMLGRTFASNENQAGKNRAVVLSHALWQRRFGSDKEVIGRQLTLGGASFTIIGVMPEEFQFPHPGLPFAQSAELWLPAVFTSGELNARSQYSYRVIARLKNGISLAEAQAGMNTVADQLQAQYPRTYRGPHGEDGGWKISVSPLRESIVAGIRPALLILFAAVCAVLLIACANVASLLVARSISRQNEIAIRTALGASRARIARQVLTENVALALLGGTFGALLAHWAAPLLVAAAPSEFAAGSMISIDARVLFFNIGLSLMTGIAFGLVPAIQLARSDHYRYLKCGGRAIAAGTGHRRLRHALVVAEVAASLVLLICAGLLIKSFIRLQQVNLGFRPEGLLSFEVSLPDSRYASGEQASAFFKELLARLQSMPGVRSAAATNILPMTGRRMDGPVSVEGRAFDPSSALLFANYRVVSPAYFKAMNIPLISGREIDERDDASSQPVAVINQTMARRVFPSEDPIGRRIKLGAPGSPRPWLVIAGIAGDVKQQSVEDETRPEMYVSYLQNPTADLTVVLRTAAKPGSLVSAVRREVSRLAANEPIYHVRAVDEIVSESVTRKRFSATLLGIFAAVSLVLATIGIYGVISYSAAQRTREIGVRMALGATRRSVLVLVLRQGSISLAAGLAIGIPSALALTQLLGSLLFEVKPADPLTFAGMSLAVAMAVAMASLLPAVRASRVDPMAALRYE